MYRYFRIEGILDSYLLENKIIKQYNLLYAIADVLASREMLYIRNKVCPFCYRRYRNIAIHLHRHGSCKMSYMMLLSLIAEKYVKLNAMINRSGHRGYIIKFDGHGYLFFKNKTEIADFIRKNPSILKLVK